MRCCDPHPTRTSGAATIGELTTGGTDVVAILTRRERRVQHRPVCHGAAPATRSGCDPHPTRTSGAASRRPPRGAGCGCDPHPTRTSGAAPERLMLAAGWAAVAILTRRERRVQPPQAPEGGSPRADVAILTRRERRVQLPGRYADSSAGRLRSSPDANVGCSPLAGAPRQPGGSRCDPHPTRTSGAAALLVIQRRCTVGCDPHPTRTSGAACGVPAAPVMPAVVAILTRRERRVQPQPSQRWRRRRSGLRSSPDANVGCSTARGPRSLRPLARLRSSPDANVGCSRRAPAPPRRRRGVAILTRRERRVQPLVASRSGWAGPGCDPHPTRTSGAALPPPAGLRSVAVAILTRRERRVQRRGAVHD